MTTTLYQVDSFTATPFAGNPAGVCVLSEPGEEEWMQTIAREMNLSETAFLHLQEDGYRLRWFTPATEVDLCGHATLASAHILWETGRLPKDRQARFHSNSGLLTALHQGDWIQMDFPNEAAEPVDPPPDLMKALGISPVFVGRNRFSFLAVVDHEKIVRGLRPDFTLLKTIPPGVAMVTAPSENPRFDFISRFFAPSLGIDEDPVTGSAHSCLGPYWSVRLGRNKLVAYQASPRGGVVQVEVKDDRVLLGGQAVTVMKIELL